MAKNNHSITEFERDLNRLFSEQDFSAFSDKDIPIDRYLNAAAMYATVENGISVLSDLRTKRSYIFYGSLGDVLGIFPRGATRVLDTIWEEEILSRIDSSDLEKKQSDELLFFTYVRKLENPMDNYLSTFLHMADSMGKVHTIRHRIFYFGEGQSIRYALCLYNPTGSVHPSVITNTRTGEEMPLSAIAKTECVLSKREIEVLSLISRGYSSKEIASILEISLYTVNRHRQNIIASMNVRNSTEACKMAGILGLL